MALRKQSIPVVVKTTVILIMLIIMIIFLLKFFNHTSEKNSTISYSSFEQFSKRPPIVKLNAVQLRSIKIQTVTQHAFSIQREAIGNIDFDPDSSVPVYPPNYTGKIISAFTQIGDDVKQGQALYSLHSPDLSQAEMNLITANQTAQLTLKVLTRDQQLYKTKSVSEKELDQAKADHRSAEGAYKAARQAVRIFGKSEEEMDHIFTSGKVDSILVVPSPLSGRITQRNAAPGMLVQPGTPPAPYVISDMSTLLMAANVPESDSPLLRVGQEVTAKVMAYPQLSFSGKISTVWESVDPVLHTVLVHAKITNPQHLLRPGMLANFIININSRTATAVPTDSIVRKGNGSMTLWLTKDQKYFEQRVVQVGLWQDGYAEILQGVSPGELIVSEGALFLDNMLVVS